MLQFKCALFFFKLTTNQKFDIFIMSIIMLNMVTMAMEYHNMEETYSTTLNTINVIFIAIFTLECVMKLIGLRHYYFKQAWNVFDFVVVVLSVLGMKNPSCAIISRTRVTNYISENFKFIKFMYV